MHVGFRAISDCPSGRWRDEQPQSSSRLEVGRSWRTCLRHRPEKTARVKWRDLSTTDPATITEWFGKWPDSLPAIDLAKSHIVIIDGDRHGGPDGVKAAEQLFAERAL